MKFNNGNFRRYIDSADHKQFSRELGYKLRRVFYFSI